MSLLFCSKRSILWFLVLTSVIACTKVKNATEVEDQKAIVYNNPPADGFNVEASDPIAILLADQIMNNMGGRKKWDETRYLKWNFFGKRMLIWDKFEQNVRVEIPTEETAIIVNIKDKSGQAWINGRSIDGQELDALLERAYNIWVNDAYWLVMPFKLKDSGVTLTYAREDTTQTGVLSDVLRLTFENVGNTPQNAYEIWVPIKERLVKQWAYFRNASDSTPAFITSWDDYKSFDGLLLASERGDRKITDIAVLKEISEDQFYASALVFTKK